MGIDPFGIVDDAFGKNGVARRAGKAAGSVNPVVGAATKMVWNEDESGGEPPPYTPYTYDQGAFTPSLSEGRDVKQLRGFRDQTLSQGNLGQADSGLFAENLQRQNEVAAGRTPSIAEMQMQRQVQANNAQQMAAAGSARGQGSMMLANMNAANMVNANNRDAAYAGQIGRAQEMEMARQGLFAGISANRRDQIAGQKAQADAVNGTANTIGGLEKQRHDMAIGFQDRNAGENRAMQGRTMETWSQTNASNAAADAAAANQQSQNTQLGANMAMKYLGK